MAQMNLDQVIAQYLAPLSPTTRATYKSTINSWLRWCDLNQLDPLKATASHIEVYGRYLRAQLGRSVHYQATSLSVISNLYKQAHHAGLVPEDPGPYVRRPKVPNHSTGTILERDQARDLLHAAIRDPDPRLDALTRLLLLNGCRLSEALNLDIPDHHPGEHPWILVCRKGGWEQRIGITQATSQAITRITGRRTHGPVFRRHDQRLPRGAARRLIAKLASAWTASPPTACAAPSPPSAARPACPTPTSSPQQDGSTTPCSTTTTCTTTPSKARPPIRSANTSNKISAIQGQRREQHGILKM